MFHLRRITDESEIMFSFVLLYYVLRRAWKICPLESYFLFLLAKVFDESSIDISKCSTFL